MSELPKLPIDDFIEPIKALLQENLNIVVTAAPGAGKTTRLPPALAQLFKGKTFVLEPRRMAAIAAAHRIAEECQQTVGQEIGYQVRFGNKFSADTQLVFMTEALLARRMLNDPELSEVDLIILDEFHERSLHVDLALGLVRELQEMGREIRLVIMSATLEAQKISEFLGGAPIVEVPGKLFPMQIHHIKESQILRTLPVFFDRVHQTIKSAFLNSKKDILVFLPGVGEIERLKGELQDFFESKNIEIATLHGQLKIEDQRRVLQSSQNRRIILATNIAESSVTVDGVDTVIDTGLAKVLRQDPKTGFSRLELERISLSSAIQRSGRSARQYPGTTYRLWNKHEELNFSKSETPEIQRTDLSESLLYLSAQGVSNFKNFKWFEKPPSSSLQQAENYLLLSGALEKDHEAVQLTDLGRNLLQLPLPVRLGRIVISGQSMGQPYTACLLATVLQERDLFKKNQRTEGNWVEEESDLRPRLEIFEQYLQSSKAPLGFSSFQLNTMKQAFFQIEDLAKKLPKKVNIPKKSDDDISLLLVEAFADRLCRRRGESDRALMVGRRGVKLSGESVVKKSEFFFALQGIEGASPSETLVSLAHGIEKDFLLRHFSEKIKLAQEIVFNPEKGQFYLHEFRVLWDLPLEEPRVSQASKAQISEKIPEILTSRIDQILKENTELSFWWQRLMFLKAQEPELELSLDQITLSAFEQASMGESNLNTIAQKDLVYFFESTLPTNVVAKLNNDIPDKIQVPSGSLIRIHYPLDKGPYVEVRIQEIFGLKESPKIYQNTLALTFHLLGPNFRPVQVTSNLESFWKNAYQEVRKELRLKYPKHQWPEDPTTGTPEAKGRRRQ